MIPVDGWKRMRRVEVKARRVSGKVLDQEIFLSTKMMVLNPLYVPADARVEQVIVRLFARSNMWLVKVEKVVSGARLLSVYRFSGAVVVVVDEGVYARVWFSKEVNRWLRTVVIEELLLLEEYMAGYVRLAGRRVERLRLLGEVWWRWVVLMRGDVHRAGLPVFWEFLKSSIEYRKIVRG